MDPRESAFLQAVMGPSGAQALAKAPAELAAAVMPRCILAWLGVAAPGGYEGQIPGLDGSAIQFSKGEGAGYCGEFSSQPGVAYTFDGASLFHLAGAVAVSLGTEVDPVPQAADLALLGKSVDAMVKAHVLGEELRRRRALSKAEPPGQAAPQFAPEAPAAPTPTLPKPGVKKKLPKAPGQVAKSLRITKSQARWARCAACKGELFKMVSEDAASWRPAFVGCQCYAEAADAVRVLTKGEQVTLEFDPAKWDDAAIESLVVCIGDNCV